MSGATDSGMVKTMGAVMGSLVVLTILSATAARLMGGGDESDINDPMMRKALLERIEPVASVRTSIEDLPSIETPADTTAATEPKADTDASAGGDSTTEAASVIAASEDASGLTDGVKGAVDGICSGCHIAGVAGAPKIGDKDAWQERADKGMDALVASVTNGVGAMPPRGGSALTDAEIPIAIQYLMDK